MKPYILTGVGVSLASGIPTFRGPDPDAVWSNRAVETGTRKYFLANPVESWLDYLKRFISYSNCEPNKAHILLSKLEEKSDSFTLVTQNVDGLHSKAGSKDVSRVDESDIVIALGTSLQVGIAKYIRDATRYAGIPFVLIDPFLDKPPLQGVKLINQTADEFLESFIETGEILGKKYN